MTESNEVDNPDFSFNGDWKDILAFGVAILLMAIGLRILLVGF